MSEQIQPNVIPAQFLMRKDNHLFFLTKDGKVKIEFNKTHVKLNIERKKIYGLLINGTSAQILIPKKP